jgi:3-phenylpropionate/trans-cinnamate dioxygenase ferredoxin component
MNEFMKVAGVADVPDGILKTCIVGGQNIAVANVGGAYYAVADRCTHEQCSLGGEGILDGTVITCGCHGAQFDVTTGKVLSLPAVLDLKTYEVKISGADILVKI